MSLRKNTTVVGFDKFESENISDFETAIDDALGVLEDKSMSGSNDEPEVTIILRNSLKAPDGFRVVNVVVYVGATIHDIAQDLTPKK